MNKQTKEVFMHFLSEICKYDPSKISVSHNDENKDNKSAAPDLPSDTWRTSQGLNYKDLFELSNAHSLAGLFYEKYHAFLLLEKSAYQFRQSLHQDVFFSVNRSALLCDIAREFTSAGITFICMKGSVFRDYYPIPELRSMGDVDLIIHPEDVKKADRIMTEVLGYRKFVDHQSVWTYILDQFQFEIHNQMFYENLTSHVDYITYFDQVWEHCHPAPVFGVESPNMYVPDEDFHFLYLMTHTAKHVINQGSGFRAYLDMVMMVKAAGDRMDWPYIENELEKLELLEFTKTCFSCCEKWFGVQMPLSLPRLDKRLYETITEKTLQDGIFGFENKENRPAASAKYIEHSTAPYTLAALGKGIKKIFPPYEDLQLVPWYSFIDGRPWLLPAVWVYRWGYCIVKKLRHSINILAEPFTKKKEVQKRQELIRKWGL